MGTETTKIPSFCGTPSKADTQLKQLLDAITEALEVRLGRRGDPRDRAITLRELIDSGMARELLNNPFDPGVGVQTPGFEPVSDKRKNATIPPVPTGLSASGAFTKIILVWDNAQMTNLAYSEIYRAATNFLGDAVRHDTTQAFVYADTVDPGETFYYWVRHVSTDDIQGPFAGSVTATTAKVDASIIQDAIITGAKLVDGAVTAVKIAEDAVTTAKIANDAITTAVIAAGAITATEIGSNAVTTAKIANDAITTGVIAAGAITATELGSAAVTTAKIANDAVTTALINASAITTTEIADDAISTAKIAANAITASEIASNAITSAKIAANTIVAGDISSGTITATEIATDAITSAKIAANAITASEIAAGTITTTQIAANTIVAGDIAAGTLTATEIASNAITSAKIAANTIVAADIASGTITSNEIAATTIVAGDIAAGTITGTQIAADTIAASNMAAGAITASNAALADASVLRANIEDAAINNAKINDLAADKITAGTIHADRIGAASIEAGLISSTMLATNQAKAFTIEISSGGHIRQGQSAFNVGEGWFLGTSVVNSTTEPRFSIGNPDGEHLVWNADNSGTLDLHGQLSIVGLFGSNPSGLVVAHNVTTTRHTGASKYTGNAATTTWTTARSWKMNGSGTMTIKVIAEGWDGNATANGGSMEEMAIRIMKNGTTTGTHESGAGVPDITPADSSVNTQTYGAASITRTWINAVVNKGDIFYLQVARPDDDNADPGMTTEKTEITSVKCHADFQFGNSWTTHNAD